MANLNGTTRADTLHGGLAADSITGAAGNDLIFGDRNITDGTFEGSGRDSGFGAGAPPGWTTLAGSRSVGTQVIGDNTRVYLDQPPGQTNGFNSGLEQNTGVAYNSAQSYNITADLFSQNAGVGATRPAPVTIEFRVGTTVVGSQTYTFPTPYTANTTITNAINLNVPVNASSLTGPITVRVYSTASGANGTTQAMVDNVTLTNSGGIVTGGDDTLDGGAGNDTIFAGFGNDSVLGSAGDDSLYGEQGDDTLNGGIGNDQLFGGDGSDTFQLTGVFGSDTIFGGSGGTNTDVVDASTITAAIAVTYANKNGTLTSGANAAQFSDIEVITTGSGNDTITATANAGAAVFNTGAGNDSVLGGAGSETIFGGIGNDSIYGGAGNDSIYGGVGDDLLSGGAGGDLLDGGDGFDTADYTDSTAININLGSRVASGGEAAGDTLLSIEGVIGGGGADSIVGSIFDNRLDGNAGNDTLNGRGGNDTIFGGDGLDTIYGGSGADSVSGDDGNDSLFGGSANDTLDGGLGNDQIYAGAGNDSVIGGDGDDTLYGGTNNDTLNGNEGNDSIFGGGDNDVIDGGDGNDLIRGDGLGVDAAGNPTATATTQTFSWTSFGSNVNLSNGGNFTQGVMNTSVEFTRGSAVTSGTGVSTQAQNTTNLPTAGTNSSLATSQTGDSTGIERLGIDFNSTSLNYDSAVRNVAFKINDIDTSAGNWQDIVTVRAFDGTGARINVTMTRTGASGPTITGSGTNGDVRAVGTVQTEAADAAGSVLVNIPGPVARIEIDFGNGITSPSEHIFFVSDITYTTIPSLEGNDSLTGGAGVDTLYGDGGNDTLRGGADDDLLFGGNGNDSVYGDEGTDTLFGGDGTDQLFGGIGDDIFYGGAGNDTMFGGDGADTFVLDGTFGTDSIQGGEGGVDNDTIDASAINLAQTVTYTGGETGNLIDTAGNRANFSQIEVITTGAGNDTINAGSNTGASTYNTGLGNDSITGGTGAETINAGDGDDTINGGGGADLISGGSGADTFVLTGNFGADTIFGGESGTDIDLINAGNAGGNQTVTYTGNKAGTIGINAANTATFAEIESITTGGGNDTINAALNASAATYDTGAGNDSILAGSGNDTILAGAGNDTLNGGAGNDSLVGGQGNDTYVFTDGFGNDTIFGPGDDGVDTIDTSAVTPNQSVTYNDGNGQLVAGTNTIAFTSIETITTGVGNDTIDARNNPYTGATFNAGAGNDSILGGSGGETINGDDGDDFVDAGGGNDSVYGGLGNDTLIGGAGNDSLYGGDGADIFIFEGAFGADSISGGDGIDTLDAGAVGTNQTVSFTNASGNLSAGTGLTVAFNQMEVITTGAGNDTINAANNTFAATFNTGAGNDSITGGTGAETINAGDGNDFVNAGGGADSVYGGDGNDTINGGAGNDQMFGGTGADTFILTGTFGTDTIVGGESGTDADLIDAGTVGVAQNILYNGNKSGTLTSGANSAAFSEIEAITTGGGNDTINAALNTSAAAYNTGVGNDSILAGSGDDTILAGAGNDTINGGAGNDSMVGGDGADTFILEGAFGTDTIIGGEGGVDNDFIDASGVGTGQSVVYTGNEAGTLTSGANSAVFSEIEAITTGAGNDTIDASVRTAAATYNTGAGDDSILGGSGAETVLAGDGNDFVNAGAGNDSVYGGLGNDTLNGGAGADLIDGGDGIDTVDYSDSAAVRINLGDRTASGGNAQGDTIFSIENAIGGAGADRITGSITDNVLDGGDGNDSLYGGGGADTLIGGAGTDVLDGGAGSDSLYGGDGADTLSGGASADQLFGGIGDDLASGGGGNDAVFGGDGNDTLSGNDGNDTLDGGAGNDSLIGGGNDDVIDGGEGNDVIRGDGLNVDANGVPTATATAQQLRWTDYGANNTNLSDGATVTTGPINASVEYTRVVSEYSANANPGYLNVVTGGQNVSGLPAGTRPNSALEIGQSGNSNSVERIGIDFRSNTDDYANAVRNVAFRLNDLDGPSTYRDSVVIRAYDAAGNPVIVNVVAQGGSVTVSGSGTSSVSASGTSDGSPTDGFNSIRVEIPGPVSRIEIDFADGRTGTANHSVTVTDINYTTIPATEGNDSLTGGAGNDTIFGDGGNDTLLGGADDDVLYGGTGNDQLFGGTGNDTLVGGAGADTLTGGAGRDTFIIDGLGADLITDFTAGSEDPDQNDFIDLSAFYNETTLAAWNAANPNQQYSNPLAWMRADQADGVLDQAGGLRVQNNGTAVAGEDLGEENTLVLCFAEGTLIETLNGPQSIEDIEAGDLVLTTDEGFQPVLWMGSRLLDTQELMANPHLCPIRIRAGSLGMGLPARDLIVSPQHRVLVKSRIVSRMLGDKDALVAAKHLVGVKGIEVATDIRSVRYFHMLFDKHQIVYAEGAKAESLYTGPEALRAMDAEALKEIFTLLPMLAEVCVDAISVRPMANGRVGRTIAKRHIKNGVNLYN